MFENTKMVIKSRKSNGRQYSDHRGKEKKDKQLNLDELRCLGSRHVLLH